MVSFDVCYDALDNYGDEVIYIAVSMNIKKLSYWAYGGYLIYSERDPSHTQ
jgi:hypothetical protein